MIFAASLLLLAAFVARVVVRAKLGVEILPVPAVALVALFVLLLVAALGVLEIAVRLGGPGPGETAARAESRLGLKNLLSAGLAACRLPGDVAILVARRAADAAEGVSPEEIYPVRRSFAKLAAAVPLLLVAVYLVGQPPGHGPIPLEVAAGEGGKGSPEVETERAPSGRPGREEERRPTPSRESEKLAEPEREDVLPRLISAKDRYRAEEPVLLFVLADPGPDMKRPHDLAISIVLDGEAASTARRIRIEPGRKGEAVASLDARKVEGLGKKLTPGKHRAVAILTGDGITAASNEVEFTVEGGERGGGGRRPEPQPTGGASPEEPPIRARDRIVNPLFREGETVKKEGIALVPDPKAPAGAPPRRMPMEEAAALAGRRGRTDVPVERIPPADRPLVKSYFEKLRGAR